ncbi:hypothetical protein EPN42_11505 [bacterium]|nr:MAG: hypothetical protein EPN42_11505 [bacterium]
MRALAVIVLFAFVLTACGRSGLLPAPDFTLPQVSLLAPVQNAISFTDAAPLALYGAKPIVPLFALPDVKTNIAEVNLAFWGTKDAAGNILQLTEAGVSGLGSTAGAVHVFFDTSQRPVLFRDDTSGYSLKLSYDSPTQQTVTICDPGDMAVGYAQIFIANGVAQAGPASAGGSCTLTAVAAVVRAAAGLRAAQSSGVATNVSSLASLAQLIAANAYVGGMAFAIGAIMKFKAHKTNPSQTTISTPIVLIFVAAALLFTLAIFQVAGGMLYGSFGSAQVDGALPTFVPEDALPGCAPLSAACPFPSPDPTP